MGHFDSLTFGNFWILPCCKTTRPNRQLSYPYASIDHHKHSRYLEEAIQHGCLLWLLKVQTSVRIISKVTLDFLLWQALVNSRWPCNCFHLGQRGSMSPGGLPEEKGYDRWQRANSYDAYKHKPSFARQVCWDWYTHPPSGYITWISKMLELFVESAERNPVCVKHPACCGILC